MATPDPFMDELRIMSYAPRPRACKDMYNVPRRNDFIEVLWCLDEMPELPDKWCPAEVLHTSRAPDQEQTASLAKGILLYLPGETWNEQIDEVEFLSNQTLRCTTTPGDREEEADSDGESHNPTLRWRFREEQSTAEEGEEWTPTRNGGPDRSGLSNSTLIRDRMDRNSSRSYLDLEVKAVRDGHASLAVDVEKLKRELMNVTHHLHALKHQDFSRRCTDVECVLPRLRQRLALRMQACLKQSTMCLGKRKKMESELTQGTKVVHRIHSGVLRVRVECSLLQFESFCRRIRSFGSAENVFFFPEFAYTQLPSDSSTEFRVLFKTFSQLCNVIGVTSATDKKEMARRCGKSAQGEMLRMLGTYHFDEENDQLPAKFYPSTSCGTLDGNPLENDRSDCANNLCQKETRADQLFPVLTRKTGEWNDVDARFVHKMQLSQTSLPQLPEECSLLQAFALIWKRAGDVGGKGWSMSMTDIGQVFGLLEMCIPFVQTQGRIHCKELAALADDDLWDEMFRPLANNK